MTGATGFKGSWLAIWLLSLGAKVIDYSLTPKTQQDNYVICGLGQRINHINGDIRNAPRLSKVFQKYNPDIAFHLAAQAIVLDSYKDPYNTFSTNVMGTVNVLEAIRKTASVKAAVIVTSDKCYKNRESSHGYRETDCLGGKDPYSASKAACEIVASSYINSFFLSNGECCVATVRAGNVIGGGDWSVYRIMPDCIRALSKNKRILIRNPNSIRPWQHVLDPLNGYLALGYSLLTEGRRFSGAWNFGPKRKNCITVRQFVEETIKHWGKGSYTIVKNKNAPSETKLLYLDIVKAKSQLNWQPTLDYRKAIEFTVREYNIKNLTKSGVFNQRLDDINQFQNQILDSHMDKNQ